MAGGQGGGQFAAGRSINHFLRPLLLLPHIGPRRAIAPCNSAAAFNSPGGGARWIVIGIGTLAVAVPLALEGIGVLPHSYEFRDGALVILPRMHGFSPGATVWFLGYIAVAHIVAVSMLMGRLHEARLAALEKLHKQTWQLKQLIRE